MPDFQISSRPFHSGCSSKRFIWSFRWLILIPPREKSVDLVLADDTVLLCDSEKSIQRALNSLTIEVSRFGMCFALSDARQFFKIGTSLRWDLHFVLIS